MNYCTLCVVWTRNKQVDLYFGKVFENEFEVVLLWFERYMRII